MDEAKARRRAILYVLAASATFAVVGALVKAVVADFPTVQIVFFRSFFVAIVLTPVLWRQGGWRTLRTRWPLAHAIRSGLGLTAMWCTYYGLGTLPLATNTALSFAMPLMLTLMSIPLLGEKVGARRFAVVLAGLAGVLVICQPWQAGAEALPLVPVLVVLLADLTWAGTMITIRKMGALGEANVTIVMWFSIAGSVIAAVAAAPVWVMPTPLEWLALAGVGVLSGLAQMLMTEGYRSGQSSVVAPFEYGAIIYSTAMGAVIWGEFPDAATWAGVLLVIGAGLYLWWDNTA